MSRNITMEDRELIDLHLKGDMNAFNTLVRRHQKPVFNYILKMIQAKDDAADLTQDVFIQCHTHLVSLRDKERFTSWLYTIAVNRVRDFWRKQNRTDFVENDRLERVAARNPATSSNSASRKTESEYRVELVRRALGMIPAEQREVLVLKIYQGQKFAEIAEIIGVPLSTVKSRLYYGLSNMRKLFKEWKLGDSGSHEI